MNKKVELALACGLIACSGMAKAEQIVDFEDFGNANMINGGIDDCAGQGIDVCTLVGTEFTSKGATLSFTDFLVNPQDIFDDSLKIIRVGGPTDGFVPGDNPVPNGAFGDFFLATEFNDNTHFSITFEEGVNASFDIADIDGSGDNDTEFFSILTFLDGIQVGTTEVFGDGTVNGLGVSGLIGDALVTTFNFANVDRIEIAGTTVGGTRNIGYGIDNLRFNPVPEPGTLIILFSGIVGLGLARKRKLNITS